MTRFSLLALLVLLSASLGFIAAVAQVSSQAPATAPTSLAFVIGYEAQVQHNQNPAITVASSTPGQGQGPSAGSVSVALSLSYQGLSNNYEFVNSAQADSIVVVVPVATETVTSVTTTTTTKVVTTTISGKPTVITQVQTITLQAESGPGLSGILLPAGVLAAAVLGFLLLRGRR